MLFILIFLQDLTSVVMSSPNSTDVNPLTAGIILFLCVVALALNILVIVVILKRGNLKSSVDIFLINLAISDSLLAGVVYPLHFKNVFLDDGYFDGGWLFLLFSLFVFFYIWRQIILLFLPCLSLFEGRIFLSLHFSLSLSLSEGRLFYSPSLSKKVKSHKFG